jgi:chaperonin GroES
MSLKKLIELHASNNIAEDLDDEKLLDIAHTCIKGYKLDDQSRQGYIEQMKEAMAIAKQIEETKTFPWPNAANVKYPLITGASIQFASRVYPEIVKGDKVVKVAVIGADPEGKKAILAEQISRQMSDQLLIQSDEWEPGTDQLLHMLPILGTVFRKTYWNEITNHIRSELITPDEVVINANIKTLNTAPRISHILYLSKNDCIGRINAGLWRDIDLDGEETLYRDRPIRDSYSNNMQSWDSTDPAAPFIFLEQHCYIDLDDDGYAEPYIVTLHLGQEKVVRIVARYDLSGIKLDEESGKVIRIDPVHYFTSYIFLPNPDGSFYGIGFGQLLLPINKTINTLLNQLIDSGTLANMQGGFLGRGVRIKNGKMQFKPGEWIPLESATGISLKDNIIPLPFKEPSNVLFQLLGLMMNVGKELSSVSDAMQGQEQAQNVPATTILALIEQGTKVFSSIQKRLYRSFKQEFEKIYRLNALFFDAEAYDIQFPDTTLINKEGYNDRQLDVCPVADPNISSETQRMMRIQALMQIFPTLPPEGQRFAQMMYLKGLNFNATEVASLLPPADPNAPPPPEVQKIIAETQTLAMDQQAKMLELQLKQGDQILAQKRLEIDALRAMAQLEMAKAQSITAIGGLQTDRAAILAEANLSPAEAENYAYDADTLLEELSKNDQNESLNNAPGNASINGAVPPMAAGPANPEIVPGTPTPQGPTEGQPTVGQPVGSEIPGPPV